MVIGETTYLSGKCILVDRKCCGKDRKMSSPFIFPSNKGLILIKEMKTSVWRWVTGAILLAALNLAGLAAITLYAYARNSKPALQKTVLCPSSTAELSERKKKTMPSTTHAATLPLIDTVIPSNRETATFGLG